MLTIVLILMSILIILSLAFMALEKKESWDSLMITSFECGFSSYFYSRFSFSIHYYMLGLIFLFLDLELCILTPFFNEYLSSSDMVMKIIIFIMILLIGLLVEWKNKKIEWIN